MSEDGVSNTGRGDQIWRQLKSAARTDLLTGCLNEAALNETLAIEIGRDRPAGHRAALLAVYLDGIGEINHRHGHAGGDQIIKAVADMLVESTRRIDTTARISGSKFAVVMPETDEHTGFLVAEQILSRLRRGLCERCPELRVTIGVASYPVHGDRAESLFRAAAAAADVGERLGSDRVVVYSSEVEGVIGIAPGLELREERTHLSTVLSLAEVLDLHDDRYAHHSMAVARYCELIGRELGLTEQRLNRLRLAGLLHDIGKVGIPT